MSAGDRGARFIIHDVLPEADRLLNACLSQAREPLCSLFSTDQRLQVLMRAGLGKPIWPPAPNSQTLSDGIMVGSNAKKIHSLGVFVERWNLEVWSEDLLIFCIKRPSLKSFWWWCHVPKQYVPMMC